MKRFIITLAIATIVLANTAGPAFAAVCMATRCVESNPCLPEKPATCPMEESVPSATHSKCSPPVTDRIRATVPVQPATDDVAILPSAPFVPHGAKAGVYVASFHAPDARGAPHLTAVMRT